MIDPAPSTMDELRYALAALPPVPRARLLSLLVDRRNASKLAAWRRAAVAEAVQAARVEGGEVLPVGVAQAAVAAELGVSPAVVSNTVSEHRRAQRAQA